MILILLLNSSSYLIQSCRFSSSNISNHHHCWFLFLKLFISIRTWVMWCKMYDYNELINYFCIFLTLCWELTLVISWKVKGLLAFINMSLNEFLDKIRLISVLRFENKFMIVDNIVDRWWIFRDLWTHYNISQSGV